MGNVFALARDSLTSLVSRMGTDRDKAATTFYAHTYLTDDQIIAAYSTAWLPRKIVDIPALDACRKWRDWQAKKPQIGAIEEEEKRLNVKGKILEAAKKARLFGGAAVYIGTGDADPAEPLDVERIKKGGIRYLNVMTRRKLNAGEIDRDPESEWYGKPKSYTLAGKNGQQITIHPSRLVLFSGAMPADDEITNIWQGWGESVLQSTLDAVKNADSTAGNIASLVFEAKIDIIRIPNFMASLGQPDYRNKLLERYTLANTAKGINGTLLLDKEEEYETKSAQLAGLTDVLMAFLQIVAGAADIPVTRLLGQSPAGMNSTGESDMNNYHDRIQSMQELEFQPAMRRLDEALERSADVRDPDVYYRWAPLKQMTEEQRATIFKTTADAARQLVGTTSGQEIIPREAVSDALVNRLVEDGVLPGLDAAIEEYGKLSEQEPSDDEVAASVGLRQAGRDPSTQVFDAAPRTLYIRRDVLNADDIREWAKGQGFDKVQDGLHVTVIHTRTPMDWIKVGEDYWGENGKMTIAEGGPRLMERFGDAIVLQFASSRLAWRHEDIKQLGAVTDFPEYQPHITITWAMSGDMDLSKVQPYRGKIDLGPEIFEEVNDNWRASIVEDAKRRGGKSGGGLGNRYGNHFDPSQARGANGRWIETGAEGKSSYELSAEHRKAIESYTGVDYKPINWQLRGIRPETPEITAKIKELDAALSGWTMGEPATVYRGIGSLGAKRLASAGLKKGSIIEDPGFMSTSRSPAVARAFAQQSSENIIMEIRAGKSAKALDVRDFSDAGGSEQEVLFARNSRLKVVSFNKSKRTLVVETVDD